MLRGVRCQALEHAPHGLHGPHQVAHRPAGLVGQTAAGVNGGGGVLDQRLDLARGLRGAPGQNTHLAGHHGETAALVPGPRGFHRRVERQHIGLEGDAIDHADDVGDLVGRRLDLPHGLHQLGHRLAAVGRHVGGLHGHAAGLLGGVGVLGDDHIDLLQAHRRVAQAAVGVLGAAAQLRAHGRDLARSLLHAHHHVAHLAQGAGHALLAFLQPMPHRRDRADGLHIEPDGPMAAHGVHQELELEALGRTARLAAGQIAQHQRQEQRHGRFRPGLAAGRRRGTVQGRRRLPDQGQRTRRELQAPVLETQQQAQAQEQAAQGPGRRAGQGRLQADGRQHGQQGQVARDQIARPAPGPSDGRQQQASRQQPQEPRGRLAPGHHRRHQGIRRGSDEQQGVQLAQALVQGRVHSHGRLAPSYTGSVREVRTL